MKDNYHVITRGSQLAMLQSALATARLRMAFADLGRRPEFTISTVRAIGDKHRDDWDTFSREDNEEARDARSRKWTLELEKFIQSSAHDVAIHSGKDLPFRVMPGTKYLPILEREDPRDVFIGISHSDRLSSLRKSAVIGTNSKRRRANLAFIRPDFEFSDYSGNVTTRIKPEQMREKQVDGVVMAAAGLKRLGIFDGTRMEAIHVSLSMPCANQGILAAQISDDCDPDLEEALMHLQDSKTVVAWHAERSFLECFDATCETPISVFAQVLGSDDPEHVVLSARIPSLDHRYSFSFESSREIVYRDNTSLVALSKEIGHKLAERALGAGAREVIR